MSFTCSETEGSSSGKWLYMQLMYGTFHMHRSLLIPMQVKGTVP